MLFHEDRQDLEHKDKNNINYPQDLNVLLPV